MTTTNPTPTQQGETLLWCPWCPPEESDPVARQQEVNRHVMYGPIVMHWIECDECNCRGPYEQTEELAASAWNTRAAVAGPRLDAQKFAEEVVGTVFDNTGASHETLKATMIERIADAFAAATSSPAPAEPTTGCSCCDHPSGYLPAVPENGKWLHQGRDSIEPCTATPRRCGHCGKEKTSPECWNCGFFDATAPPETTQATGEQEIGPLQLYDRADGVKGHFCVGRKITGCGFDYNEFWNKNKFCSAGEVFIGKEAAKAKLNELSRPSDSARRAAEELTAMFTELSNCYMASKCAATDREESLRLRGMAKAYADAARRCQEFPARRRNDGTLITAAAPAANDALEVCRLLTTLDWIVGYELAGDNQTILDRAQELALKVMSMSDPPTTTKGDR